MVKDIALKMMPRRLLKSYRSLKRRLAWRRNANRTVADVFGEVYARKAWGGGASGYFSGKGSRVDRLAEGYISAITTWIKENQLEGVVMVDLGCGDFTIGEKVAPLASEYIGIDVVPALVEHLRGTVTMPNVRFVCADATKDDLPPGRVIFVRQVLQHLSNAQISNILTKLDAYEYAVVTEHQPRELGAALPNVDKVHGGDIRLYEGSGVYLDKPPFGIAPDRIVQIWEAEGHSLGVGNDSGMLRTFVVRMREGRA